MDYESWKNVGRVGTALVVAALVGALWVLGLLEGPRLAFAAALGAVTVVVVVFMVEALFLFTWGIVRVAVVVVGLGALGVGALGLLDPLWPAEPLRSRDLARAGERLTLPDALPTGCYTVTMRPLSTSGGSGLKVRLRLEEGGQTAQTLNLEVQGAKGGSLTQGPGSKPLSKAAETHLRFTAPPGPGTALVLESLNPTSGVAARVSFHEKRVDPVLVYGAALALLLLSLLATIPALKEGEASFFSVLGVGLLFLVHFARIYLQPGSLGQGLFAVLLSALIGGVVGLALNWVLGKLVGGKQSLAKGR
jgi:hypothetical protein